MRLRDLVFFGRARMFTEVYGNRIIKVRKGLCFSVKHREEKNKRATGIIRCTPSEGEFIVVTDEFLFARIKIF